MRLVDKDRRNEIFEAIRAAGLDPRDFELDNDPDADAEARISHRGSDSCFTVAMNENGIGYSWTQVVGDLLQWPYARRASTWGELAEPLRSWLGEVKRDIETPDLWAELRSEREMLAAEPAQSAENTPFTADEQAEIASQLREIKQYVKRTHALSESQTWAMEAQLDYLEDAAGRLGRVDWRNVALATLFSVAAAAILPPDDARRILLMLLQPLGQLFGHSFPELSGGAA